jgi:isoprenylcysteine carboxyl methyltransferase (ICMT) family protein YpbQ
MSVFSANCRCGGRCRAPVAGVVATAFFAVLLIKRIAVEEQALQAFGPSAR